MSTYVLRAVDPALWRRFKVRAAEEGIPMRALMLSLIELYADRKLTITNAPKIERV